MPLGSILKFPCNFLWRAPLLAPLIESVFESWFSFNGWLLVVSEGAICYHSYKICPCTHTYVHTTFTRTDILVFLSFYGHQTQFVPNCLTVTAMRFTPNHLYSTLTSARNKISILSYRKQNYIFKYNHANVCPHSKDVKICIFCKWIVTFRNSKRSIKLYHEW